MHEDAYYPRACIAKALFCSITEVVSFSTLNNFSIHFHITPSLPHSTVPARSDFISSNRSVKLLKSTSVGQPPSTTCCRPIISLEIWIQQAILRRRVWDDHGSQEQECWASFSSLTRALVGCVGTTSISLHPPSWNVIIGHSVYSGISGSGSGSWLWSSSSPGSPGSFSWSRVGVA